MSKIRPLSIRSLKLWGMQSQINMAPEELSECLVAIQKFFNRCTIGPRDLASEVADVEIMMDQIRCIIGDELVDQEKEYKLKRLAELLDRNEQQQVQEFPQVMKAVEEAKHAIVQQIEIRQAKNKARSTTKDDQQLQEEYKTYEEWKAVGLHVKQGEKSHKKSDNNKSLFSRKQVVNREEERKQQKAEQKPEGSLDDCPF